jgi:hypothetical protein
MYAPNKRIKHISSSNRLTFKIAGLRFIWDVRKMDGVKLSSWFAFLVIGLVVGVAAFIIDVLVEYLVQWKW